MKVILESAGIEVDIAATESEFIPVCEPEIDAGTRALVAQCLEEGWISSSGPWIERFEAQYANSVGRRFGIAVANGSAALDIAVTALGIGPGDEVILPSFTIVSCAAAVVRAGAVPVLVDSHPTYWTMDVSAVESRIGPRTRAIMAVHIYGLPVDLAPLLTLAERHGLALIEDAAEAHGACYDSRACGSFGDVSVTSFYANKFVTTGEGGMVLTDDDALACRCRSLRNLCFQSHRRFVHHSLGWNYRMTSMQAALGLGQLAGLHRTVERKQEIAARYRAALADVPELIFQPERTAAARNVNWVVGALLDNGSPIEAEEVIYGLKHRRIEARPFFWPMHEQPVFRNMGLFEGESYPVAEGLAQRGFYAPNGMRITDAEIERICGEIRDLLRP
jgi:perosamine synthetase